tara:strand:+ start:1314 stop:2264 length:951 start_codon:yes stop_codon:yes gene_type:complete
MKNFIHWFNETLLLIHEATGLTPIIQTRILSSVIWILVLFVIRKVVLMFALRNVENYKTRYGWRKYSSYVMYFLIIFFVGRIWSDSFETLSTFLGLLSAGIAISLKDPLVNFAGWSFIMLRKPFELGDRVQVGDSAGDVIDIGFFQFTLIEIGNWVDADQSTGRIIHVPNGKVFNETQANYNKGFEHIWNEIPVVITFESDWKLAKQILTDIINEHAKDFTDEAEKKLRDASSKYLIFYSKLTPIVYTSVKDSGVCLTIRYLCPPRRRRGTLEQIWEQILTAFDKEANIDLAYTTYRVYNQLNEGKEPLTNELPQP